MKSLAILLLLLAAQSEPRAAWDVADKWTCEMTKVRVCTGVGGKCRLQRNIARFGIDFPANSFGVDLGPDRYPQSAAATPVNDFSEIIIGRAFYPPSAQPLPQQPGYSKFVLEGGDAFALSGRPHAGSETRDAILHRTQFDAQYHFYGTCSPKLP